MWIVALMSALIVGAIVGFDPGSAVPDSDEPTPTPEPDPITPIDPDPTPMPTTPTPTPTDPVDPVDPVDPDAGVTLTYDGSESILGGAGDDTLLGDPSDDIAETPGTTTIELGGGNDLAEIALDGITANGGPGDDTITGLSQEATILGGEGNDSITGMGNNDVQGGAGDDQLTIAIENPNTGTATISGGEGDDVIRLSANIGSDNTEAGNAVLRGDAGADTFDLEFTLTDTAIVTDGPTTLESNPNMRIMDFVADDDVIQVEILRPEGAEARAFSDTTFTADEDEDGLGPYTDVTLTFAATETVTEVTSTFRIYSASTITAEDIEFVVTTAP